MDEVDRAVDRIDQPRTCTHVAAGFLAEHRVVGKRLGESHADVRLHRAIGHADEVLRPLGLGVEVDLAVEIAKRELAGFARKRGGERRAGFNFARRHAAAIGTTP